MTQGAPQPMTVAGVSPWRGLQPSAPIGDCDRDARDSDGDGWEKVRVRGMHWQVCGPFKFLIARMSAWDDSYGESGFVLCWDLSLEDSCLTSKKFLECAAGYSNTADFISSRVMEDRRSIVGRLLYVRFRSTREFDCLDPRDEDWEPPLGQKLSKSESPIEEAMLVALRAALPGREISQQVPLLGGKYRLDFAFVDKKIAVECDGHEFHERTKEQAARDRKRDRDLVADGWRVLRFTGSEIHKDAAACAAEVAKMVNT